MPLRTDGPGMFFLCFFSWQRELMSPFAYSYASAAAQSFNSRRAYVSVYRDSLNCPLAAAAALLLLDSHHHNKAIC